MQGLIFAATTGVGLFLGTQLAGFVMDKHSVNGKFQWPKIWALPAGHHARWNFGVRHGIPGPGQSHRKAGGDGDFRGIQVGPLPDIALRRTQLFSPAVENSSFSPALTISSQVTSAFL